MVANHYLQLFFLYSDINLENQLNLTKLENRESPKGIKNLRIKIQNRRECKIEKRGTLDCSPCVIKIRTFSPQVRVYQELGLDKASYRQRLLKFMNKYNSKPPRHTVILSCLI